MSGMIPGNNLVTEAAAAPKVVGEGLSKELDHGYTSGSIISPPKYQIKDMKFRRLGGSGLRVPIFSYGGWLSVGSVATGATVKELMQIAWDHVSVPISMAANSTFLMRKADPCLV
ncbi:hypothetical protein PGT21_014823 [Puccinia graminis f. sp. tritici]|uniref:Uncharacterized protein n=1 Tax=Puccinia graminis f. sp. tritici TaxID=56615 RepID=A0A5B0M075_PUCGR|nr:hypothetical protein PGT21_014823 [Puccinia graminis f. sp. tritici]